MANSKADKLKKEILSTEATFVENLAHLKKVREYVETLPKSKQWKNFTLQEREALDLLREYLNQCKKVEQSGNKLLKTLVNDDLTLNQHTQSYFKRHLDNINRVSLLHSDYTRMSSFIPKTVNAKITQLLKENPGKLTSLDSILITPVQRTPRYQLMLTDLARHSSDYSKENAETCLNIAINKAATLDEDIRLHEALKSARTTESWRALLHQVMINVTKDIQPDFGKLQLALEETKRQANVVKNKKGAFGRLRTEAKEAREFLKRYSGLQATLVELGHIATKNTIQAAPNPMATASKHPPSQHKKQKRKSLLTSKEQQLSNPPSWVKYVPSSVRHSLPTLPLRSSRRPK